jgi:hydroxypyruvate reductase
VVHDGVLQGEAAVRGCQLAALGRAMGRDRPTAFVVGGETTVTVHGSGCGGRNHELALAAAVSLEHAKDCVVLSAGTDGIDGLTEAAGAVVDSGTVARLQASGFDPQLALNDNDSGTVLAAVGDAIMTGPTGTNVCDVSLVLTRRSG